MGQDKNQYEVQLLLNNPNELVTYYQEVIEIIVVKFVSRGFFMSEEKMDIIQNINEALLAKKMGSIQRNYNGSVLLSTYFSRVVYNHCLEIARGRKGSLKVASEEILVNRANDEISADKRMILKDEINRLMIIIKGVLFPDLRLRLALKLYSRVPLSMIDFQGVLIKEDEVFKHFKKIFFKPFDELNDKEVYKKAIPFLNKITGKQTDADSMRKWMNMQIDKIIDLQNGKPPRSKHSRETMRILLQMYFESLFKFCS